MNVPSYEQLLADNERLRAELEKAKSVPMKYRRMEFNAQLQNENTRLRAELDALKASFMCVHESHETLYQELRANPVPASVPEGWQLVPVEPTQWMLAVGEEGFEDRSVSGIWRRMLAAAPKPEETK